MLMGIMFQIKNAVRGEYLDGSGRCSVVFGLRYWRSVSSLLLFTLCSVRIGFDISLFIMTYSSESSKGGLPAVIDFLLS